MARCDELEKLRAERNQKRITIHTAALNRLLSSPSSSASSLPSSSASSLPSSSASSLPRRRESSSLDSRLRGNDAKFAGSSPLDSRLRENDAKFAGSSPLDSRLRENDAEFAESSPLDSRLRGNDAEFAGSSPLDSRLRGNDVEFAEAWRFITQHFGELYSVKENVAELRKAILQLAVMGKLVPQDPNDEPASELLRAIELEKQQLVKEGKIKQTKPLPGIKPEEIPYELPKGWVWVRLGSLAKSIDYGTSIKSNDDSSKVPVYRMGNIVNGQLINTGFKYVDREIDDLPRLYLKKNDILFNRTNSYELVGKTAIYLEKDDDATFASYLIRVRFTEKYLVPTYLNIAMNASYFRRTQIEPEIVQQCGQANFNGSKLSVTLIPFPPLTEQHRIVAKIDQFMALCDHLDQQIDAATSKQTTLLNAVMAQV